MTTKSETVTFRISPEVKDTLRQAAAREHRSLANMLEVMIRDWCGREGALADPPRKSAGRQSVA